MPGGGEERRMGGCLAAAEDPDGLLPAVASTSGAGHDHGAAGVGDQAAVVDVEGVSHPAGGEDVVDGERVAHERPGVEPGPLAGGDGDLGELLVGGAVLVHVSHAGEGVNGGCAADVVGRLELARGGP